MRSWLIGIAAGVCLLAVANPARAQEQRASAEGVIKDSSGAVLPGATVEARSPSLVGTQTSVSDENGVYRFPALTPGVYEFVATLQGFTTAAYRSVRLDLGQVLRIHFTMTVGGVAETVQVAADTPLIDFKQNTASTVITREFVDRLPRGRDFTSLAVAAKGALVDPRSGGLQIDGASGSENRYLVDGMDTTNIRNGMSARAMRMDFFQEVQIKSSGYNAEYRAANGGVVSAITKSGSNAWHGSAGLYQENSRYLGDRREELRLNPFDETIAEYFTRPRDDDNTVEPVMELGGPILQDRAWFYAGYSGSFREQSRTVTFTANNARQTFTNEPRSHQVVANVNVRLLDSLRAKLNTNFDRRRGSLGLPGIQADGTSLDNPSLFPDGNWTNSRENFYSATVDWVVSPTFYVNMTTGTYRYGDQDEGVFGDRTRRDFSGNNLTFPDIPSSLRNVTGFADTISSSRIDTDRYTRIPFNIDGTYYASKWGRHTLKGGLQYERLTNVVNRGDRFPQITFFWNQSLATLAGPSVRGTYGYYRVRQVTTDGTVSVSNLGLFLQDTWEVNDRLTVNGGMRVEHEKVPSYRPENPGIEFGWGDKITPRIGVVYDLRGDGKWKLHGDFGLFYDQFKLELPRGSFGADKRVEYFYTLDDFNWPSYDCAYPPTSTPTCPGNYIEQVDFRLPSNRADRNDVDPDLKPVRTREYVVGIDHKLTRTMSLDLRYVHKSLDRTIEDVGTQVPGLGERFFITNPGLGTVGLYPLGPNFPAVPRAERQYDALEVTLRKRFSDRWQMNTIYTFSRLYGNYPGLASSDEVGADGDGRTSPNVNRLFDGLYNSFDANARPVYGRLGTDRPHTLRLQGSYDLPWGTSVGVRQFVQSGVPLSREVTNKRIPFFYRGRLSDGRLPVYSGTDLQVEHQFRFGARQVVLNVNVFNLFDQKTAIRRDTTPYRDAFSIDDTMFFAGWDPEAYAAARPAIRPDPLFLQDNLFQGARSARFYVTYRF